MSAAAAWRTYWWTTWLEPWFHPNSPTMSSLIRDPFTAAGA